MREPASNIKLEKVKASQQIPVPGAFVDASSGESNLTATPGGIGMLQDNLLRFDVDDMIA